MVYSVQAEVPGRIVSSLAISALEVELGFTDKLFIFTITQKKIKMVILPLNITFIKYTYLP